MNPFEMVLGIIIVVSIASVLKARYGVHKDASGNEVYRGGADPAAAADAARLRDEIRSLRDRIQVLERVITDNEAGSHRLEREIDALRDKN